MAKKVVKKAAAKKKSLADENPRITALRVLIQKKKITSFSQIFKEKHFYIQTLAKLIKKTPVSLNRCINEPAHFRMGEVDKIAKLIGVELIDIASLLHEDHMRLQKKEPR